MIDYEVLKILWWIAMGAVLVIYAATAGYDSGVTMIMPFLRKEIDRRVMLNTSAPTWDGNQTWIVFAGGAMFVIWPVVYSTIFSGIYFAFMFILWALFLRPPGFDYRGKLPNRVWRRSWDVALFISSVVPVFLFGVAFANCLLGFPFHFDPYTFRDYYTGSFLDLLNGFAILSGIASVVMVLMHGSVHTQRRTEGHLREMAHKLIYISAILLFILFSISGLLVAYSINGYTLISYPKNATLYPLDNVVAQSLGGWIMSYEIHPWKYFGPFAAYVGIFLTLWANYVRWYVFCFWASVLTVAGMIGTIGFTLYPFIMPSSTNPDQSLTVWNATSSQYALDVMFYVGLVLFFVILAYKAFTFHTVWSGKKTITAKDIEENDHTYY